MSRTKMDYIYDTYDTIIERLGHCDDITEVTKVMDYIAQERDDLPTSKDVTQEFINNSGDID